MNSVPCIRIVEDEAQVRNLLFRLATSFGYSSRTFSTAEQFIEDDDVSEPGCVLVDLTLPGMNGVELVKWISQQSLPLSCIVVTGFGDIQTAVQCLKVGAVDFLEKPVDSEALLKTLNNAISADAAQRTTYQRAIDLKNQFAMLTAREQQVFTYLAEGLSSKQISYRLKLSSRTVEKYRGQVMKKLGFDSLADLIRAAVQIGL